MSDPAIVSGTAKAISRMRDIVSTAAYQHQRFAIFGDSQETWPGGSGTAFNTYLHLAMIDAFCAGRVSYSPIGHGLSYGGGSPPADFIVSGGNASTTSVSLPLTAAEILPNMYVRHATSANGLILSLQHNYTKASGGDFSGNTRDVWGNRDPFYFDFWCVQNDDTGAADPIAMFIPNESNASDYFDAVATEYRVNEPNLDSADGNILKFTTPELVLPNPEADPFAQVRTRGSSSTLPVTFVGQGRFRKVVDVGGMSFQSFSVGGYTVGSVLANHANAGPMYKILGPWHATIIGSGSNDVYPETTTPEQVILNLDLLIDAIRGSSWLDDKEHLFIIVAEVPRAADTTTVGGRAAAARLAKLQEEYARTKENVVFINPITVVSRLTPPWTAAQEESARLYLNTDGTHKSTAGCVAWSAAWVKCFRTIVDLGTPGQISYSPSYPAKIRSAGDNVDRQAVVWTTPTRQPLIGDHCVVHQDGVRSTRRIVQVSVLNSVSGEYRITLDRNLPSPLVPENLATYETPDPDAAIDATYALSGGRLVVTSVGDTPHILAVSARTATPPAAPVNGDVYIVPPAPKGVWSGRQGSVAYYNGPSDTWWFGLPPLGTQAAMADTRNVLIFDGDDWISA